MNTRIFLCALASATSLSLPALAEEDHSHHHHGHAGHIHKVQAPIGIMSDHVHGQGEWMLSYRYMNMQMDGNRNGTNELSPLEISGDFANTTGSGPATLRIVPTEMSMEMHMVGAMVGVTDWFTAGIMGHYVDKEMDHITFAMMNADQELGRFTTRSRGLGDTKLNGIFRILEQDNINVVGKLGLSLPTGSITERGTILTPMNTSSDVRLPYAMQLGSGTYDLEPAVTYTGHKGDWSWGAQGRSIFRLGENDQNYTLGDKHALTGWGRYGWNENVGTSLRMSGEIEGEIDGRDVNIAGPVQTADPDNYGGERVELGLGLDLTGTTGVLEGHTIALEGNIPLYQDLNGPQMQRDYSFTIGYQARF